MRFKNKVVLITGASRGIGMATALHFGKEGAFVVVNYLSSKEKADKVVESIRKIGGNAISIKCDVSDENQVKNMIGEIIKVFGRLDILINNAGVLINKPILEKTVFDWNKVINTNLLGTFLCSKYGIEEMLKNENGGVILNLSSINGTKYFSPDEIEYDISKVGIITLTKNFAKAFSPKIRVLAIAPGNVSTEINNSKIDIKSDLDPIYLNKFTTPSDVGKVILDLVGDNFSYLNGEVVFLDGGWD
ncbi:MAG: SDR family oxidoreductase [Candidatus Gracilibacteria bacterium]|nr:SDR family oxidoreductase [Candidatus Gracilibacteria bacterium]